MEMPNTNFLKRNARGYYEPKRFWKWVALLVDFHHFFLFLTIRDSLSGLLANFSL